jgi:hypothetical protein
MTGIPAGALIRRRDDLLANELSERETVMLDVADGTYFGLQDVGKVIWDHLDGPLTLEELCERLVDQFDVDVDTCRRETSAFLESLHAQGLLIVSD